MSFIITSNDFTRDPLALRLYRLMLLSTYIGDFAVELELPVRISDWGTAAYDNFLAALQNQTKEQADKFEAFQTLDEANIDLYERIVAIKDLILTRFGEDDQKLYYFKLKGRLPKSQNERYHVALEIIKGNRDLEAAGDPNALPSGMIDALETLAEKVDAEFKNVGREISEAKSATVELRTLFDEDSRNLRELLNWIVIYWGKIDPRLIQLGFVQEFPQGGGNVPEAPGGLDYDNGIFTWDSVDGATSYQLGISADGDIWEELYSGDETSFEFTPEEGTWFVRVRGRNANGFGDWSAQISVTIGEGGGGGEEEEEEPEPGAPEWPDWPGPVEASAVQVGDGWVRITYSGLNGGKTLRIERLRQGDTDYVLVTQGLPLDDPEEVMPFDDTNLDKKKYTYKLTPFDEGGNPGTPLLIGVTVS